MPAKQLLSLSVLMTLASCGHYAPPETFESKMARYQVHKQSQNIIPEIEPVSFRVASRGPASVQSPTENEKVDFSNRKLYFVALYKQYHEMVKFSSATPREIKQCPSFHSALVDHSVPTSSKVKWTPSYNIKMMDHAGYANYFPELYLPMSEHSTPKVLDLIKNEKEVASVVQKAVDLHVDKTYAELAELCEYGTSDNYYAFENLHTEMKRRNVVAANKEGMKILLKTTLFSNKALIESLNRQMSSRRASRMPAQVATQYDFDGEVMQRLGVTWANEYYRTLKSGPEL